MFKAVLSKLERRFQAMSYGDTTIGFYGRDRHLVLFRPRNERGKASAWGFHLKERLEDGTWMQTVCRLHEKPKDEKPGAKGAYNYEVARYRTKRASAEPGKGNRLDTKRFVRVRVGRGDKKPQLREHLSTPMLVGMSQQELTERIAALGPPDHYMPVEKEIREGFAASDIVRVLTDGKPDQVSTVEEFQEKYGIPHREPEEEWEPAHQSLVEPLDPEEAEAYDPERDKIAEDGEVVRASAGDFSPVKVEGTVEYEDVVMPIPTHHPYNAADEEAPILVPMDEPTPDRELRLAWLDQAPAHLPIMEQVRWAESKYRLHKGREAVAGTMPSRLDLYHKNV